MVIKKITKVGELKITVEKGCDSVNSISRQIGIEDSDGKELKLTLTGEDALIPLKDGQFVLIDLRVSTCRNGLDGSVYHEYYAMAIKPICEDFVIEEIEPSWARYCRN